MATDAPPKTSTLTSDSQGYTRLHITPLDSLLLKVVIPAAVLPQARNISYHTLDTFPEKRYGFVELPTADADKLRKKLNGATLRGTKVRIEQARPESRPEPTATMADAVKKPKKEKKTKDQHKQDKKDESKKRKYDTSIVDGVVIEDRKIKRGWTVTESDKIHEKRREKTRSKDKDGKKEKLKKREIKSKYTDAPECLFKQKLPQVPNEPPATKKDDDDDGQDAPKRKKRKADRQVLVHEFEKAHKFPTFLKTTNVSTSSEPLTFEEGRGWIDAQGNVVEPAKSKRPTFAESTSSKNKKKPPKPVVDDDTTSSSGSSSESESEEESTAVRPSAKQEAKKPIATQPDDDATSSSGSSSDEEGKEEEEKEGEEEKSTPNPVSAAKIDSARPKSSSSTTSLTIKIPPVTPAADKVHPLEALYKRPAGTEAAPDAGFSFFGNADDLEDEAYTAPSGSQNPMTPYSKQDFDFRNIRSAAPTPDTAHPSRSQSAWPGFEVDAVEEEDAEQDETGEDTIMANVADIKAAEKAEAKSEFQNWFWEHRGDLNRSWKKRRKTASKEKRNRENRARAAKAI
ncbi:hypothetical protein BKA67DRAFT_632325 [Truncatella angustata]|uniref:Uncharacterized protein n=1 Tax=Truncatella angustata TaxID=152316 RepID=A0A9P8U8A0_9PEZI|nr:uncharacterized protein BKA67DRAFT_632325 [Truncatella angustata]KAH6644989.1 hypothetical protein BKA67DRAFT_632325 [Truncatella angustata]